VSTHWNGLSLKQKIQLLRSVPLFESWPEHAEGFPHVAEHLESRVYLPQQILLREGELGSELFILIQGKVAVMRSTLEGDPYKIALLEAKPAPLFFGEGALLQADARSATIQAETQCECLIFSQQGLRQLAEAYPKWAVPLILKIAQSVMERLNQSNRDLVLLYGALVKEIRGDLGGK
jgi:CRP/FNR family cyclic AMP-dependent transcriptional regulator